MVVINSFGIDKNNSISFDNNTKNTAAIEYLKSYLRPILDRNCLTFVVIDILLTYISRMN